MSRTIRTVPLYLGVLSGMLILSAPGDVLARQWHVTVNGTENPSGTISQPWSIFFALSRAENRVGAGDTVWLHGGVYTYSQGFFSDLVGTPGQLCLVKPWQNERVILRVSNGPAVAIFAVYGSYTMYVDLEFDCAVTNTGQFVDGVRFYEEHPAVPGGGRGNRLINCVIRNATNSGISDQDAESTELYGNIVYYSGRRTTGGNAYAVYGQNHYPSRKLYEHNVFLSTFADYVLHMYGTNAAVDNITLRENVIVNTVASARLMFSSALHDNEGIVVERNFFWGRSPGEVMLQERKGMVSPVYRGNIFARGLLSFRSSTVGRTFEQNFVWGSQPEETTSGVAGSVPFDIGRHPNNDWQIDRSTVDLDTVAVLRNRYQAGRGLLVVYNSSGRTSVPVDLSTILTQGAQYEIRDAQNIPGPPVTSGTYAGGAVDVTMTSSAIPAPVTQHPEFPAPSHTGAGFGVFVVTSDAGNPPPPDGPVDGPPEAYSLEQNFPNPFNPSTHITFRTPDPGMVALYVYDLLGREIARPADGFYGAGTHTVVFGAEGLAGGVYFYRLITAGYAETRKMVVIR